MITFNLSAIKAKLNGKLTRLFPANGQVVATVYIPSTKNTIENGVKKVTRVETTYWLERFQRAFSGEFGGFTVSNACGGWIDSDTGKIVTEEITRIETIMDDTYLNREFVKRLADFMRDDLSQDAVLVTYATVTPEFVTRRDLSQ